MSEPRRPLIHFTPRKNWLNDPNGLILHKGQYHLYFQHNPHGDRHGNMSWGHATSTDLIHWSEHPVALMHDDVDDVFSGSVVWDEHNTSGLGPVGEPGPLVAIYTAAARAGDHQAQAVAFSLDDGFTWVRHVGNPVLDLGTDDFRDPKVFRYDGPAGAWWVMVAVEARSRRIVLHRSPDLLNWELLSRFGPAGAVEGLWECPDLFPIAVEDEPGTTRWVLLVSVSTGAIAGGTGTQYFVGDFDGTTFTPEVVPPQVSGAGTALEQLQWLDHGTDCYAGVTFSGTPAAERILIAWMSNWDYAQDVPTSLWRGSMTIPRRLGLTGPSGARRLHQSPVLPEPVEAVQRCARRLTPHPTQLVAETLTAMLVEVAIRCEDEDEAWIIIDSEGDAELTIHCTRDALTIERASMPLLGTARAAPHTSSVERSAPLIELALLLDATSVETFVDNGQAVFTELLPSTAPRRIRATGSGAAGIERMSVALLE